MKDAQNNVNNYYQLNQFQNSLNLKAIQNKNFDNNMIIMEQLSLIKLII